MGSEENKPSRLLEAKEWLQKTVELIADYTTLSQEQDEMGVLFVIKVGRGEAGKLIGKQGNTIKLVRELARIIGLNIGARISIKVEAPAFEKRPVPGERYNY